MIKEKYEFILNYLNVCDCLYDNTIPKIEDLEITGEFYVFPCGSTGVEGMPTG